MLKKMWQKLQQLPKYFEEVILLAPDESIFPELIKVIIAYVLTRIEKMTFTPKIITIFSRLIKLF